MSPRAAGAGPVVVLVGPPGAGKTTVGRALAELLAVTFRDTDRDIEAASGMSVADIFLDHGEAAFRELERTAVVRALAEHDGVLALGGGAVLDPATQQDLRAHAVAFLDVGITHAARRIGFNRDRPLLLGNPRAQWVKLAQERQPIYAGLATVTVSTDELDQRAVAQALADALGLTAASGS